VNEHPARLPRLEQALQDQVKSWRLNPVVEARQAWRGVPFTVAVTIVAAWGDLTRVDPPRQLMSDLGLTPRTIPVVRGAGRVPAPRPGRPMPDAPSWKAPGPIATLQRPVAICNYAWTSFQTRSSTSGGKRPYSCVNGTDSAALAVHPPTKSWWPWPATSSPFGGPWPKRSP
jgi:hypothetical protein